VKIFSLSGAGFEPATLTLARRCSYRLYLQKYRLKRLSHGSLEKS